jgi:hypothetical protein
MVRRQLQELLDMLATLGIYEADWESKHPLRAAAAREANNYSRAVRLVEMKCKYPARCSPPTVKADK